MSVFLHVQLFFFSRHLLALGIQNLDRHVVTKKNIYNGFVVVDGSSSLHIL